MNRHAGGSESTCGELIERNVGLLQQAEALVASLSDADFTTSPAGLSPHKAGDHLRHILEFYECFLDGVESYCIDYDSRRRDNAPARSRRVALERIHSIIGRLLGLGCSNAVVLVRAEDMEYPRSSGEFLTSSISRELQVLSSHTVHHFALISVTLRALGCEVDEEFGMAPSTLTFLRRKAGEAQPEPGDAACAR